MTFLQPVFLAALPLAALPIIIHLIHLYRRRQVKWAAMMFLRQAQRMNKGLSRLRQILILALRVLAVAAMIFVVTRPLAGGWLGLTGGAPDTVLILLDRSASMEQQNLATGITKRAAGLRNLAKAINDAVGTRSKLVLLESVQRKPLQLNKADALLDLPETEATDTTADMPALLQGALDYVTTNKTGRTDVWLLSDLQRGDWDANGGRWEALRSAFASLQGNRFHLLAYPQPAPADDLGITVDHVTRRETAEKAELLMDIHVQRHADHPAPMELPLRFVVNGVASTVKVALKDNQLLMQAFSVPIGKAEKHGWGRVELPADSWMENNTFHFVYDELPVLRSVIVSDDSGETGPLQAALSAAADPARKYEVTKLSVARAAEIPWDETALIVWQAPLPKAGDALARQLEAHAAAGRTIVFLPPELPDDTTLFGLRWTRWETAPGDQTQAVEWWRNDSGLLANTQDGAALPVGVLELNRRCGVEGEGTPLARCAGGGSLLMRATQAANGGVYFLATLTGPGSSSLARDGVVMFVLMHRALEEGAQMLGKAQQRDAGAGALGADPGKWHPVEKDVEPTLTPNLPLRGGVVTDGVRLIALNRPASEDQPAILSAPEVNELFVGLDFRLLTDNLEDSRDLTNEVWRTFLMAMALALVAEALLCMPPRRELPVAAPKNAGAASPPEPVAA